MTDRTILTLFISSISVLAFILGILTGPFFQAIYPTLMGWLLGS